MTIDSTDWVVKLQALCDAGQRRLVATEYLAAEAVLVEADRLATARSDWDTLSRLYMPLQEARRQRRQRCGEGVVCLDLLATGPEDDLDARRVLENYPHGQLLVAGWGSIAPALEVRRLAREYALYVETYLAAVYVVGDGRAVAVVPTGDVSLPTSDSVTSTETLVRQLPPHAIVWSEAELPTGARRGTPETFAETMAIWERLHAPFLADADARPTPGERVAGYRRAIEVDYAAEKPHQRLSAAAAELARG